MRVTLTINTDKCTIPIWLEIGIGAPVRLGLIANDPSHALDVNCATSRDTAPTLAEEGVCTSNHPTVSRTMA
jgi:hypothetical protein